MPVRSLHPCNRVTGRRASLGGTCPPAPPGSAGHPHPALLGKLSSSRPTAPSSLLNLPAHTPSLPYPAPTRPWIQSMGAPQNPPESSARRSKCMRSLRRPKHLTSHILCLVAPRCLGHFSQQQQTPINEGYLCTGNLEKMQILEGCLGTHDNLSFMAHDALAQKTKTFWFDGTGF